VATILPDCRVQLRDGRIVSFTAELNACDLLEIAEDFGPSIPTVPFGGGAFISGGGGRGDPGGGGPQGSAGAFGGPAGAAGPQGGADGTGPQGAQGSTGVGPQGSTGPQGDAGAQGTQGAQGAMGTGTQGPQGQTGATGPQGFQGFQGILGVGTQGPQGLDGNQGLQGPQEGPQGFQGPQPLIAEGWTDDGTVVRLTTSTDNVGIGTAAPGSCKLAVFGDVAGEVVLCLRGAAAQSADILQVQNSAGSVTAAFNQAGTLGIFATAGDAEPASRLSASLGLEFGAGGASAPDVRILRGAANRLDLAAGDSVAIPSGSLFVGATGPSAAEIFRVVGDARIEGKLTVTGAIDPTSVLLSSGTALFFESNNGNTAPVSGAATGRIRYNNTTGTWQISTQGGAYVDIGLATPSGWTDDGTVVRLTTASDNVGIGTAAPGAHKTLILGDVTTEVTLGLRATGAQSANILQAQTSAALVMSSIDTFGQYNVFGLAGDAQPTVRIASSGFSPSGVRFGVGGATALNVRLYRHGTVTTAFSVFDSVDSPGGIMPAVDNGANAALGTATFRWNQVSAVEHDVFAAAGAANPTVRLRSNGIFFGPGGASALNVGLSRHATVTTAFSVFDSTISPGGIMPAVDNSPNADLGSATFRWNRVSAVEHDVFVAAGDAQPSVRLRSNGIFFGPGGASALNVGLFRHGTVTTAFTVFDSTISPGGIMPGVDNSANADLGSSSLRWNEVVAVNHDVFVVAGDAQPSVRLQSDGIVFGVGGATAFNIRVYRHGTVTTAISSFDSVASLGGIMPAVDSSANANLGSSSLRWNQVSAVNHEVFGAAGDANPTTRMDTAALRFGAAGITPDTRFARTAAIITRLDNGAGAGISFFPGADAVGDIGNASNRWSLVRAVTITSGDVLFENGWRMTEDLGRNGMTVISPRGTEIMSFSEEGIFYKRRKVTLQKKMPRRGLFARLFG
jgi:hypothetical protein